MAKLRSAPLTSLCRGQAFALRLHLHQIRRNLIPDPEMMEGLQISIEKEEDRYNFLLEYQIKLTFKCHYEKKFDMCLMMQTFVRYMKKALNIKVS